MCKCSLDNLLVYSTPKVVVIRDRWLGFLRLFLICPVLVYLVYAVIIDGKYYILNARPEGGVFASVFREPTVAIDISGTTYCTQNASPLPTYARPCAFLDTSDIAYPPIPSSSLLVTTAFTRSAYSAQCGATGTTSCLNPWGTATSSSPNYVAVPEKMYVRVQHYVQGSSLLWKSKNDHLYALDSGQGNGYLLDSDGNKMRFYSAQGTPDDILVSDLLDAADVSSLDVACDSTTCDVNTSIRGAGLVLLVYIEYENKQNLQKPPDYNYRVKRVYRTSYSVSQLVSNLPDYTTLPLSTTEGTRTVQVRHGIQVVFIQSGEIGRFDFPSLFVHVASGVALILLAGITTDLLMLFVCPRRHLYRSVKYEKETDFDRVWNKTKLLEESTMGTLLPRATRERIAFAITEEETRQKVAPIEREIMNDPELNERRAEAMRLQVLTGEDERGTNHELTNEELEALFRLMDVDGNKVLEFDEIKRAFELMQLPQSDTEITKIIRKLDTDNNGVIDKDEFLLLCKSFPIDFSARARVFITRRDADTPAEEKDRDMEFLEKCWESLNKDPKGNLSYDQVQRFLVDEGIKITPAQFTALMRAIDVDGDKSIDFQEFCSLRSLLVGAAERKEVTEPGGGGGMAGMGGMNAMVPARVPGSVMPSTLLARAPAGSVHNKLNTVNWNGVKSQFRAMTTYINGLRDELSELTTIVRLLQERVIPQTLENVIEFNPVHLDGDWTGEQADECKIN